ncbi:unnamed protein product [Fraxinus pennsylvanica]|uniref:Uncharacterized protein n=1 Tax=Fraxinus pennsylvanica TaxID=56036 RepID=A0AAD2A076_9LAMI|nr:unnamed protein product [Fraxinus pennsylvanica]
MFVDVYSKIEGSKATTKLTAEVLRSFISQKRLPRTNQASALIDAVNVVGEKLIDANPVGQLENLFEICQIYAGGTIGKNHILTVLSWKSARLRLGPISQHSELRQFSYVWRVLDANRSFT